LPIERLGQLARELTSGSVVHVKTDLLGGFEAHVLPFIAQPIVLVTGDSDAPPMERHGHLLRHPMVAHWFAQNCDLTGRHDRLTRIPIGMDNPIFTKLDKRIGFVLTMLLGRSPIDPSASRNDMGDQQLLNQIRVALPVTERRPPTALCTFHQNQRILTPDLSSLPDRSDAYDQLKDSPGCIFVSKRLPQRECWWAHGGHAFEVSPQGNGLDCFRPWEALMLGTIPIVRHSPLDSLFEDEGLPVVLVDRWSEVTAENLRRWHRELAPRFDRSLEEKLLASHWIGRIRSASERVRTS